MFVEGEGWVPTAQNLAMVEKYAAEVIPLFPDPSNFRSYLNDHKLRIGFDVDYAERFLPVEAKVLEIGALPYFLTLPLINKGFAVTALDKATAKYNITLPQSYGIKVWLCDLDMELIPEADQSFDAVVMNEVFEHLRINLIFSLSEVYRVLRPGGRLLLSTPNLRSFRGLYNLLIHQEAYSSMGGLYENYSHLESYGVMGHVREYTAKEVTDLLLRIGFTVEGVIFRGSYAERGLWRVAHYVTKLRPEFKPFFSLIATRPA